MTGSSVNFQPIKSAMKAVNHADRTVPPKYLLSAEHSQGAFCLYGKDNNISDVLENKLSLASRQAKREKNFSPLWEGVINLPRPTIDENFDVKAYKKECTSAIQKWVNEYPKMTGHTILRIDLHLDEGLILENGEVQLNAHAHVMIDRTNELGRVKKLSPKVLREIQTMTAEATGLPRGESSFKTGASHLSPQDFKQVAEKIRLEKKSEVLKLKEQYDKDREALKASGIATQKAYQDLKIKYNSTVEQANSIIEKLTVENEKMKTELTDVRAQAAADLAELTGMKLSEAKQRTDLAAQSLAGQEAEKAFLATHKDLATATPAQVGIGGIKAVCGLWAVIGTGRTPPVLHKFSSEKELQMHGKGKGVQI